MYRKSYEEIKTIVRNLADEIMNKYDNSKEIAVRVNLLPQGNNSMSEHEKDFDGNHKKVWDEEKQKYVPVINEKNKRADPINVAIHETSPGKTPNMDDGIETDISKIERPTKPEAWTKNFNRYDNLARYGVKGTINKPGPTVGYHARIDYPGLMGRPEIVILEPAVCSPDQIKNKLIAKYTYGIERCVGEEQNYHLAIANQAMLTAFVLREMGYDKENGLRHCLPHNYYAENKKACPARMLYASALLNKAKKQELTEQEIADIKEYVPWEVYMKLVETFLERNKYPQELEQKFIYDMSDYEAYVENPGDYNYRARKPLENIKKRTDNGLSPRSENKKYDIIKNVENIDTNKKNEKEKYNITWKNKDSEWER